MRTNSKKILGAVAVAGLVATGGSAFTAGGLSGAPSTMFVGGSVDQTITGAVISSVVYDVDEAANKITSVTLTFTGATTDGKTPTITFTGAAVNGTYTCAAVDAVSKASSCTATTKADTNVTSLDIQVA